MRNFDGQHFLENTQILQVISDQIPPGSEIVEIGAGTGQLTKYLLDRAKEVTAIEIDPGFQKELENLKNGHENLEVITGDALEYDFSQKAGAWIVGNIPYHITESLVTKLTRSKISGAVLLVGESFAREVTALEAKDLTHFGKLTLTVNAFFQPRVLQIVGKENFSPPPRTKSVILSLTPRADIVSLQAFILRRLLLPARHNPLIKNALLNALIVYKTQTKNEARSIISKLNLPREILEKNFEQLNNFQYLVLYQALKRLPQDVLK